MVGMRKGDFQCDHIKPRPISAPIDAETYDADGNLQTLCTSCHSAKTARERGKEVKW